MAGGGRRNDTDFEACCEPNLDVVVLAVEAELAVRGEMLLAG